MLLLWFSNLKKKTIQFNLIRRYKNDLLLLKQFKSTIIKMFIITYIII